MDEIRYGIIGTPHHIMVEKPLCTTIADCRKVIDTAASHYVDRARVSLSATNCPAH